MIYEDVIATGNYIVLKGEVAKDEAEVKTKSGLVMAADAAGANSSGQKVNTATGKVRIKPPVVHSIGPKVNVEELGIAIGDQVIINDYDAHSFTDDTGSIYVVCRDVNVQCVIKCKE